MTSPTHTFLSIGQTLSFALPGPYGPVVAAGLQFIDMMSGDSDTTNRNQDVLDAIQAQTEELENFIATMKLDDLKVPLKRIGETVQESSRQIKDATAEGPTPLRVQLRTLLDKDLAWIASTDNDPERTLDRLLDIRFPGNNRYELHKTAVGLYLDLLMALICLLKLRCELQSQWVSLVADEAGNDSATPGPSQDDVAQMFTELNRLWARLAYWTEGDQLTKLTNWVDWIKTDRISLISDIQHEGRDSQTVLGYTVQTDFFTDAGQRVASMAHGAHTEPGPFNPYGPSLPTVSFVSHEAEVKAQHDAYVAAQKQAVTDDLSYVRATIDAITSQRLQVKSLTPPPQPGALSVAWTDTGWPHAWRGWPGQVRYGMQYVNSYGASPIVWSEWGESAADGRQCPHLTLPSLLPAELLCSRVIYRQRKDAATTEQPVVRDNLPVENDTLEYVDLDPADAQDACPSALQPPILANWREEDSPPPLWDKGLPVRYRYRYRNAAGRSLASSPWAIVDPAIGARADTGFITPKKRGFHSPTLRIKRLLGASTVEVYRQIGADGTRVTLAATPTAQGRFFVVDDIP